MNVIIVTRDVFFQRQMQSVILQIIPANHIFFASGTLEIQSKLVKAIPAVIVFDLDSVTAQENLLAQMSAAYRLLLITTGASPVAPISARLKSARYIAKPRPSSEAAFLSAVRIQINSFVSLGVPQNTREMRTVADRNQKIIAIASSTGGTDALQKIFLRLDQNTPPVVVVQHMPSGFTKLFADRLNNLCKVSVKEAQHNDYLRTGLVLIAPAGLHMTVALSGGKIITECGDGPRIHGVIPSADLLFDSVAAVIKNNAVGVILTGMGSDGAKGLFNMHGQGARTIGQNQETCVVYGMPKVAYDLGAVDYQLPIDSIADKMLALAR